MSVRPHGCASEMRAVPAWQLFVRELRRARQRCVTHVTKCKTVQEGNPPTDLPQKFIDLIWILWNYNNNNFRITQPLGFLTQNIPEKFTKYTEFESRRHIPSLLEV